MRFFLIYFFPRRNRDESENACDADDIIIPDSWGKIIVSRKKNGEEFFVQMCFLLCMRVFEKEWT